MLSNRQWTTGGFIFLAAAGSLLLTSPALKSLWSGGGASRQPFLNSSPPVLSGLDVLAKSSFEPLRGLRVGVITNHTGRTRGGQTLVELLTRAPEVTLAVVFAPEHGLKGELDEKFGDSREVHTGVRVFSLYGETRRPAPEMLEGLDALVFDIQDAGVRYYTYATTMAYAMEAAAERKLKFFVLDRPNPLNGAVVNGPILDADKLSFTGYYPLPLRHGMTVGELARLYNQENRIGAELTVIEMQGWQRSMWFDDTGLEWVSPSPALRSLAGSLFYPAVELLRAGNVSVGRGTETPFEIFGAPWIDGDRLMDYLNRREIPGVRFEAIRFNPADHLYAGDECAGVRLRATDRDVLDAGRLGMELIAAMNRFYPEEFELEKTLRLVGSSDTLELLKQGTDPKDIVASWQAGLKAFRRLRTRYLIYE